MNTNTIVPRVSDKEFALLQKQSKKITTRGMQAVGACVSIINVKPKRIFEGNSMLGSDYMRATTYTAYYCVYSQTTIESIPVLEVDVWVLKGSEKVGISISSNNVNLHNEVYENVEKASKCLHSINLMLKPHLEVL